MKFVCLGFMDEAKWKKLSEKDQIAFMDDCVTYDAELRRSGRLLGSESMQGGRHAVTIRWQDGHVAVDEGTFAKGTERLGGFMLIEARDLNHAIQLMSKHPGVRAGAFEIRPSNEEVNLLAAR